ncbi:hypothetical protein GUITHDRAFT_149387 [Guillardia theta CCMP2712]|uniref:Uncharacterized protein n=1 Tax=Guillardia theta (strain CCMP2712) TaxID=905079 RepID=L1I619_GUITC|nr:hypothetical protein GUITHDRAFT_149387 [Guillardia theta CCMP2712]EKX31309.1 hypothetical protein GUITHDRAFT_149387 [Guillardia theta CCMP2712]|eukprot:XP_005818289.1 hypothetical protein GUITHDRAFT_149387 [Guillardia theta CCMP2712]
MMRGEHRKVMVKVEVKEEAKEEARDVMMQEGSSTEHTEDGQPSGQERELKRRRIDGSRSDDETDESAGEEHEETEVPNFYSTRIVQLRNLLQDIDVMVPQSRRQELGGLTELCFQLQQMVQKSKVCLLGTNGVGKSYLINVWLMITSCLPSEYEQWNWNQKSSLIHENVKSFLEKTGLTKDDVKRIDDTTSSRTNDIDDMIGSLTNIIHPERTGLSGDGQAYLLPSQELGTSNTTCAITLIHSKCFCMLVEYRSKEELLKDADQWLLQPRCRESEPDYDDTLQEEEIQSWIDRYNAVVADQYSASEFGIVPEYVKSIDDVQMKPELEKLAGRRNLYVGKGRDLHNDRAFIRELLVNLQNSEEFKVAVKSVIVGVPSAILEEVDQLTDCPGTNEKDTFLKAATRSAIEDHDVIVILADKALQAQESSMKPLCKSEFLKNMVRHPERFKIVVFFCNENSKNLVKWSQQIIGDSVKDQPNREVMLSKSKVYMYQILVQACQKARLDRVIERAKEISESILYTHIYPSLYAAIEFDKTWRDQNAPELSRIFNYIDSETMMGVFRKLHARNLSKAAPNLFERIQTFMDELLRNESQASAVSPVQADTALLEGAREFKKLFKFHSRTIKQVKQKTLPLVEGLRKHFLGSEHVPEQRNHQVEKLEDRIRTFINKDRNGAFEKNFVEFFSALVDELDIRENNKVWMSSKWAGRGEECHFYPQISGFFDESLQYEHLKEVLTQFLSEMVADGIKMMEEFMSGDFFPEYKKSANFPMLLKQYIKETLVDDQLAKAKERFFDFGSVTQKLSKSNFETKIISEATQKAIKKYLKELEKDLKTLTIVEYKANLKAGAQRLLAYFSDLCLEQLMKKAEYAYTLLVSRFITLSKRNQPPRISFPIACYEFATYVLTNSGEDCKPLTQDVIDLPTICRQMTECIPRTQADKYEEVVGREVAEAMARRRMHRELDGSQREHGNLLLGPSLKPIKDRVSQSATMLQLPLAIEADKVEDMLRELKQNKLKVWPSTEKVNAGESGSMCLFEAIAHNRWEGEMHLKEKMMQLKILFCLEMSRSNETAESRAEFAETYRHVIPQHLDWKRDWKSYLQEAEKDDWAGDFLCLAVLMERLFKQPCNALVWCPGMPSVLKTNDKLEPYYRFAVLSQENGHYDFRMVTSKDRRLEEPQNQEELQGAEEPQEKGRERYTLRSRAPSAMLLFTFKVLECDRFEDLCSMALELGIKIHIPRSQLLAIDKDRPGSQRMTDLNMYIKEMCVKKSSLFQVGKPGQHRKRRDIEEDPSLDQLVRLAQLLQNDEVVIVVAEEDEKVYGDCMKARVPVFPSGFGSRRGRTGSGAVSMSDLLQRLQSRSPEAPADRVKFLQEQWDEKCGKKRKISQEGAAGC